VLLLLAPLPLVLEPLVLEPLALVPVQHRLGCLSVHLLVLFCEPFELG
jgi:hypothetical protein